ncbi:MAG: SRPBCC family protein [Planctomycetota bacterium]
MATVRVVAGIAAPPQRCFDLARSMDAHRETTSHTGERIVVGRVAGLLEPNERVTFEAKHLGWTHRFTAEIVAFDPPMFFRDRMVRGPFKHFEHDHRFEAVGGGTRMTDELRFAAPLGPLGWLAERLVLRRHLRLFLTRRGEALRSIAESDAWKPFLEAEGKAGADVL